MDTVELEIIEKRKAAKQIDRFWSGQKFDIGGVDRRFCRQNIALKTCRFSMMLPDKSHKLDKAMLELKYPSVQRPILVVTTSNTVDFTFSELHVGKDLELYELSDSIRAVIKRSNPAYVFESTQKFPMQYKDKQACSFAYRSYGLDQDIYNIAYVMQLDVLPIYATINCSYDHSDIWRTLSPKVIESIAEQVDEEWTIKAESEGQI